MMTRSSGIEEGGAQRTAFFSGFWFQLKAGFIFGF